MSAKRTVSFGATRSYLVRFPDEERFRRMEGDKATVLSAVRAVLNAFQLFHPAVLLCDDGEETVSR